MAFNNIPYQTGAGLNWILQQIRSIWTIIVADNLIWHNRNIPAKNIQRSLPGALKPVCVLSLFIQFIHECSVFKGEKRQNPTGSTDSDT